MLGWLETTGAQGDVALSSRARLARNYPDLPFPALLDAKGGQQVQQRVQDSLQGRGFQFVRMGDLPAVDRQVLVERHLQSPQLSQNTSSGALLVQGDETAAVMINEEDHLRIQALIPGFDPKLAYQQAVALEARVAQAQPFAFDERLGYLTCCPTNVGTGLRVSVMLHLPALTMLRYMGPIIQAVAKLGMTVRGIYGEGSDALGSIYQISNQVTLGSTEQELVDALTTTVEGVIDKERESREALMRADRIAMEDRLMRAWGVFTNARKMDTSEFMSLWSHVRMAAVLGLVQVDMKDLTRLLVQAQSASVQKNAGREMPEMERDEARALLVRNTLNK